MKASIKQELLEHIEDCKKDFDEITHYNLFNEDYYIIGYYKAEQWLKEHDLTVFEAIKICNEMQTEHFGEIQTTFDDAETLVNHMVYWYGLQLCEELNISTD